MFPFDQHPNFAYEIVSNSPGTAGTAIVVGTSSYAQFPDPGTSSAYNAVVWPGGTIPLASNAEIVRVVGKATAGTLYVTRNQESSSNRDIASSDQFAVAVTGKALTDAESVLQNGWIETRQSWSYASADSPTFVITVPSDATTKYSVGMRVRLSQSTGGTKHFIITAVTSTTLTVYGGTDYTLNNEAISNPCYSTNKVPFGFPVSSAKWSVITVDSSLRAQASPTAGTWYNLGTVTITAPIGVWDVDYNVGLQANDDQAINATLYVTLSNANNTEAYKGLSGVVRSYGSGTTGGIARGAWVSRQNSLTVASKTTYYLNMSTETSGLDNIYYRGDEAHTIIRFISSYL